MAYLNIKVYNKSNGESTVRLLMTPDVEEVVVQQLKETLFELELESPSRVEIGKYVRYVFKTSEEKGELLGKFITQYIAKSQTTNNN